MILCLLWLMSSVKWPSNIYIFPPLPLTNKVITNFISDSVNEDLLITHFWPASSWYSSLRLFLLLLPFPFLQVIFWTKRFFSHSGASSDVAFWLQCSRLFFRYCQSSPQKHWEKNPFVSTNEVGDGSECGMVREWLVTGRLTQVILVMFVNFNSF